MDLKESLLSKKQFYDDYWVSNLSLTSMGRNYCTAEKIDFPGLLCRLRFLIE